MYFQSIEKTIVGRQEKVMRTRVCNTACLKNEKERNNKSLYRFVFLRLSRANSTAIHEKHILLTMERGANNLHKGKYLKKYI
jgi:hypothetical protein